MSDNEQDPAVRRRVLSTVLGWSEGLPLSSSVQVQFGACSHPGKAGTVNTDQYLVVRLGRHQETLATSLAGSDLPPRFDENAHCMLVADGLGASGGGAVASRIAVSTFAHLAVHFGQWNLRVNDRTAAEIAERAEWFYGRLHEAVVKGASADPLLSDMATTMTAAYSVENELFLVHVGHSRAYLFRDGDLTQLSSDQAISGTVDTPGQVAGRPTEDLRRILTGTIGGQTSGPSVEVEQIRLWDGDIILLCTNGLTDVVDDERIADVLALRRNPDQQCQALVDLALAGGGQDNVTVVLAQYAIPQP